MNIYEALPQITAGVKAVGLDHENVDQNYLFRSINDVYNAVNELLGKHGVTIIPNYNIISEMTRELTRKNGSKYYQTSVKLKGYYRLIAEDGSYVRAGGFIGEGLDYSDKAYNKAMTASYKYMLFQVFCIPTKEQVDGDSETQDKEITDNKTKTEEKPTQKPNKDKEADRKKKEQILKNLNAVAKSQNINPDVLNSFFKDVIKPEKWNINKLEIFVSEMKEGIAVKLVEYAEANEMDAVLFVNKEEKQ